MMMKTATVLAIALAALVALPTTARDEIAMGGGWGLSDKWDEETQATFGALLTHEVVASGYFPRLGLRGDPSDPYSRTELVRRFEIIEIFHGPHVQFLQLTIDSELLPVPGGDISVYQARRAYLGRRQMLLEQIATAEGVLRLASVPKRTLSRHERWLGFLRSEYSRMEKARPKSLDWMDVYPTDEDFYEAGPVFEGVRYLVFLGRRDDDGRHQFPVSTHPSATNRGFWGEAAEAWEARLRAVLSSDELMDELRRRRPATIRTN